MTSLPSRLAPYLLVLLTAMFTVDSRDARAQGSGVIRGTVTTTGGLPVEGAQLSITGIMSAGSLSATAASAGTNAGTLVARTMVAETNERGEFYFPAVAAGPVVLRVRRLGFRPDSASAVVIAGRTAQRDIALAPVAVTLAAVTVRGRHDGTGPMAGFYRRRATGSGRFFTLDEIEKRNPARMTDLLRSVPGLNVSIQRTAQSSVRIRGARCAPAIFLDGQGLSYIEFDLDAFDPRSFDGVEIYSGAASVPVEFQRNSRVSASCGTIILWSKRGEVRGKRLKDSGITPASLIAQMLDRRIAYAASDVDSLARVDSTTLIVPVYPPALFEAAVEGRVLTEFVVDNEGAADMKTFSAVTATHRAFVDAVRNAVSDQRFVPARRAGAAVHQVMQLPFNFVPDSTQLGRRR